MQYQCASVPKYTLINMGFFVSCCEFRAAIGQTEDKVLVPHWSNILCLHHCHELPGIGDDLFAHLSLLPKDQSYNVRAISRDGRRFHPSGPPGIPVGPGLPCI